jgi:hypothetical protein
MWCPDKIPKKCSISTAGCRAGEASKTFIKKSVNTKGAIGECYTTLFILNVILESVNLLIS